MLREFYKRSMQFHFGDHFINPHNHISWQCLDIIRRKLMLITIGTWRVKGSGITQPFWRRSSLHVTFWHTQNEGERFLACFVLWKFMTLLLPEWDCWRARFFKLSTRRKLIKNKHTIIAYMYLISVDVYTSALYHVMPSLIRQVEIKIMLNKGLSL